MSSFGYVYDCSVYSFGVLLVYQILDEMEFERGIWLVVVSGDLEEVQRYIGKGENVNRMDFILSSVWCIDGVLEL